MQRKRVVATVATLGSRPYAVSWGEGHDARTAHSARHRVENAPPCLLAPW